MLAGPCSSYSKNFYLCFISLRVKTAVGLLLESVPARGPAAAPRAGGVAAAAAQTASGTAADLVVTVSVTPNRPGVNGFTVLAASSRRPPPAPLDGVALRLARGGAGGPVALRQVAPGRWFGTGRIDRAGRLRLRAVLRRAGERIAVPLSWQVEPAAPVPLATRAGGRRLAPYVDGVALALLAGAAALGAARLLVARRRRRRASVEVHPTQPAERVLAGVEGALRAKATGDQKGVLALLARRRAQRLVAGVDPLWIVNEVGVRAAPSVIKELAARADVREVRPNVTIQAPAPPAAAQDGESTAGTPETNLALVNAPAMWDLGLRGQGMVVANMDTGVDATHPDLASRWRGGGNSWFDPNGQHPTTPTDVNGHGTWTMGVMVGGDAGGTSIGVAPDARWIAVKIFNDRGTTTSTIIHRGFQWLLDPDGNPATADAPNVVNNSWTMSAGGCNLDFQPDLANLRVAGILPVFSAGNYGPTSGTVASPANNPGAFAVGSVDDAEVIDPSSSRGPSACAQSVAPELVAPGVGVRTSDLYGSYLEASGTSLAAPHMAGALALLLGAVPGIPADRQQAALEAGAIDLGPSGTDPDYGTGRLDVLASYQWLATTPDFTVAVSPSSRTTTPGGSVAYSVSVAGDTAT